MYRGWPEAFADPKRKADTVAHLLIDKNFPNVCGTTTAFNRQRSGEYQQDHEKNISG